LNPQKWIRIVASGACFLGFGLLGMLASLVFVPLLYLLPGGKCARERRAQWAIHKGFGLLVSAFGVFSLVRITHADIGHYRSTDASVIIANHPTYIDIVILLSLLPGAVCMVKNSVWNNPCMGPLVRAAGFFPNRDAAFFLKKASQAINEGKSVIIFPEGTRSWVDALQTFQRGAAQLALRSGSSITPILLAWTPPPLQRGSKWHQMADRACNVELKALPPIPIVERVYQNESLQSAAKRITRDLETKYAELAKA
jgi:1-acyl-sn-glycerol-3-phosphate acyltransferase